MGGITLEFVGERDGIKLRESGVDLLRIEEGKSPKVRLFSSDNAQEDVFLGNKASAV